MSSPLCRDTIIIVVDLGTHWTHWRLPICQLDIFSIPGVIYDARFVDTVTRAAPLDAEYIIDFIQNYNVSSTVMA